MEDYRVKYIKSLLNVINQFGWKGTDELIEEDEENLNMLIGHLYVAIKQDGLMTKELAQELGLEYLWKELM